MMKVTVSGVLSEIEKIVVTVAAAAALFPIIQYVGEADARRVDRLARVLEAANVCDDRYSGAGPIITLDSSNDQRRAFILDSFCNELDTTIIVEGRTYLSKAFIEILEGCDPEKINSTQRAKECLRISPL